MSVPFHLARIILSAWVAAGLSGVAGCAMYKTPGGGIRMDALATGDIRERLDRKPAANFPANIAVARVQAPGYSSYSMSDAYGGGKFCVVTTRDIETPSDFERIAKLASVAGVAPISRLLLPSKLDSDADLRLAAASLRADILLVYTFETQFVTNESIITPLRTFYLGILPDQTAKVTTTASAALFDVRTGFVYGAGEATAREDQLTTVWINSEAIDQARQRTERKAFEQLIGELEATWPGIVARHTGSAAVRPGTGPTMAAP